MKRILMVAVFTLTSILPVKMQAQQNEKSEEAGLFMPDFSFVDINGKTITRQSLPESGPVIVLFFEPDCDHCQQQAKWIGESLDAFSGTTFLWVSWGEIEGIRDFQKEYFPDTGKIKMFFTKDTKYQMDNYFGYSVSPTLFTYKKLVGYPRRVRTQKFEHETTAVKLIEAIQ